MPNQFWREIPGWFDFGDLYTEVVQAASDGDWLVELGCWQGKSLAYMLLEAKASGKKLNIVGVDHFQGSADFPSMIEQAATLDLERICEENLNLAGYPYILIAEPGVDAALRLGDDLKFVFIDATHEYQHVKQDIKTWYPKVKIGGVLAGHDRSQEGVKAAVADLLPSNAVYEYGSWWAIRKTSQPLSWQ